MDYLLGHLSDDSYVQDLEGAVKDAHRHNEWRREYMTLEMKYQEKYLEGKIEGGETHLISQVCQKILKNKTIEDIADALEESPEVITPIYQIAMEQMPDFDVDVIYEKLHPQNNETTL